MSVGNCTMTGWPDGLESFLVFWSIYIGFSVVFIAASTISYVWCRAKEVDDKLLEPV